MSTPQFSLTSDTFMTNICNGLSSLQQREEFVDMTLAADGHLVKVHQIVVSLASPYLKQLILSAPCPHPVVFLNKISYPTLCSILEYIYSGEVMVNKEMLPEFIAAGQELHIKGLQEIEVSEDAIVENRIEHTQPSTLVERLQQFKSKSSCKPVSISSTNNVSIDDKNSDPFADVEEDHLEEDDITMSDQSSETKSSPKKVDLTCTLQNNSAITRDSTSKTVQYTLSNQGSLQLILNRFIYFLRYCHKNSDPPIRKWRCTDYIRTRCPASVTTKDDIVIQRVSAHKHGFHDKKILKKIKEGTIFTAVKDAENKGMEEKKKIKES